jgi:hypothetical protein
LESQKSQRKSFLKKKRFAKMGDFWGETADEVEDFRRNPTQKPQIAEEASKSQGC